jgi:uncharacterized membrane protein YczE
MIQRIQTFFLLVATLLQALLLKSNFYSLKVELNNVLYSAWQSINTGSNEIHTNILHIVLQFLLMGITLYTVFIYKNRPQQMKLCMYLILGTLLSFAFALYNLFTTNYSEYHFAFGTYIISILVIIYISAYFFIRKDDNLVKSVDRLR